MTIYELVSLHSKSMKVLQDNGIVNHYHKYLNLYEKYLEMLAKGDKLSYIVTNLSSLYEVGERTIYRVIELFSSTAIM